MILLIVSISIQCTFIMYKWLSGDKVMFDPEKQNLTLVSQYYSKDFAVQLKAASRPNLQVYFQTDPDLWCVMISEMKSELHNLLEWSHNTSACSRKNNIVITLSSLLGASGRSESYRSVFSLQWGFASPKQSFFTPESPSLFSDKSSSLRCVEFDAKADARAAQPLTVTPHLVILRKEQWHSLHLS